MPSEFIQRQKNDFFRDSSALGSLLFYCFLLMFLFLIKEFYLFKRLFFGFVLIYAATILIRTFYFKERPKRFNYNSYIEKLDASSFPSLHASRITFLSISLMNYFKNIYLYFGLSVLALLVCYSRVYLKKHDFADVIAGVVFGVGIYYSIQALI